MARYADGFVIPLPKSKLAQYKAIAKKAGKIWKEHGALQYVEAVGDDLESENMLSFRTTAGAKDDETVIFAWILFESREQRDKVNAAVMEDPRLKADMESNKGVFDFKRMAYGGFKTLVEL